MIWQMDLANIRIVMELFIKDIGKMIFNKDLENKYGRTNQNMKDFIITVKDKVKEYINQKINQNIMDNGIMEKLMDLDNMFGLMGKNI